MNYIHNYLQTVKNYSESLLFSIFFYIFAMWVDTWKTQIKDSY